MGKNQYVSIGSFFMNKYKISDLLHQRELLSLQSFSRKVYLNKEKRLINN